MQIVKWTKSISCHIIPPRCDDATSILTNRIAVKYFVKMMIENNLHTPKMRVWRWWCIMVAYAVSYSDDLCCLMWHASLVNNSFAYLLLPSATLFVNLVAASTTAL